jgi:hypothetical protein
MLNFGHLLPLNQLPSIYKRLEKVFNQLLDCMGRERFFCHPWQTNAEDLAAK